MSLGSHIVHCFGGYYFWFLLLQSRENWRYCPFSASLCLLPLQYPVIVLHVYCIIFTGKVLQTFWHVWIEIVWFFFVLRGEQLMYVVEARFEMSLLLIINMVIWTYFTIGSMYFTFTFTFAPLKEALGWELQNGVFLINLSSW